MKAEESFKQIIIIRSVCRLRRILLRVTNFTSTTVKSWIQREDCIVVSSKTETLNNGQVTSKFYFIFDPRQKASGLNPLNTLTTKTIY